MRTEADYCKLLEKAQEATDQIEALLAAIGAARGWMTVFRPSSKRFATVRTLQRQLDQLWDEFKRI
jgi:hypothetical protein